MTLGTNLLPLKPKPSLPPSSRKDEIKQSVNFISSSFDAQSSDEMKKEERHHRYVRSILQLCRQDSEEVQSRSTPSQKSQALPSSSSSQTTRQRSNTLTSISSTDKKPHVTRQRSNTLTSTTSTDTRNQTYTQIQELKKSLKKSHNKLGICLQIARLYVNLGKHEDSIAFFNNASKVLPYKPPFVSAGEKENELHKIACLGKNQKVKYLALKQLEDEQTKAAHNEDQRVRVRSANYEIFTTHLLLKQAEKACFHMRVWYNFTGADANERLENIRVLDDVICKHHDLYDYQVGEWRDGGYNAETKYIKNSIGSILDFHLEILEEYLISNSDCTQTLMKLSRLHSFKRDYARSLELQDRCVQISEGGLLSALRSYKHKDFYTDKLSYSHPHANTFGKPGNLTDIGDESAYSVGMCANRIGGWSVNALEDRVNELTRSDLSCFSMGDKSSVKDGESNYVSGFRSDFSGGKHIGSSTIIYSVPPGGWSSGIGAGNSYVEVEIKSVNNSRLHGYKGKIDDLSRHTMKRNDYDKVRAADGSLLIPRPISDSSKNNEMNPPWLKAGTLPPRLHMAHDFRRFSADCDLSNPDIPVDRKAVDEIYSERKPKQKVVRFRKKGSALTQFERNRLDNIVAVEGMFGRTLEKATGSGGERGQTFPGRIR